MTERQKTIEKSVRLQGDDLHSGKARTMTFAPAAPGTGLRFQRIDLENSPEIPADISNSADANGGTTLGNGDVRIRSTAHALAAVSGLGIDNLLIQIAAEELPAMDGSALPFVKALKKAGIVEQDAPRASFTLQKPITVADEDRNISLAAYPADSLKITYLINENHPLLNESYTEFSERDANFEQHIAPARAWCFLGEVENPQKQGLPGGATLENTLVLLDSDMSPEKFDQQRKIFKYDGSFETVEGGILNQNGLRLANEPAAHKVLDLLGDLALLGAALKAHIVARRSGHAENLVLVKRLQQEHEKQKIAARFKTENTNVLLDAQALSKILPHRYPFLLVDRIIDMTPMKRVVGIKNVTINEPFFTGHFPGHPIMPGVLILEAMAQVGGILLMHTTENPEEKLVYFTGLNNVKFRRPVRPGDQIRFEVEMLKFRRGLCKMTGKAYVDGKLTTEADLSAAIVDKT